MELKPKTGLGWAWFAIVLAGVFPFVSDMSRNFQLFSVRQLLGSLCLVGVATSAVFVLGWATVLVLETVWRRRGHPPGTRIAKGVFALCAAGVFAVFLYDANLTEFRQSFELSRMVSAMGLAGLFAGYVVLAAWLGSRRVCGILGILLVLRLVQAGFIVSDATQGDDLMSSEEIAIYEEVKLSRTPNIYYICLESYHGFDTMKTLYGFDNAAFQTFLSTHGFSVEPETFANYWHTMSSLHSTLRMGHHYAAGTFGNHDSLYARGFISGSGTYYNPVLHILKKNGYVIVYLLPSDYYYRPGAGLVDISLLEESWPWAPLKVSLPRFIGREPDTLVEDYEEKIITEVAAWPSNRPAFFFMKLGAEHASHTYDYRTDRPAFVAQYVRAVKRANIQIEALCRQIMEKDPEGIIILAGDHGAQGYRAQKRGFLEVLQEDGIPAARLVRDLHEVLLAIRWGEGRETSGDDLRTLANVMRSVFLRLGADSALRSTWAADDSYFVGDGALLQTVEEGQPLLEWKRHPWNFRF